MDTETEKKFVPDPKDIRRSGVSRDDLKRNRDSRVKGVGNINTVGKLRVFSLFPLELIEIGGWRQCHTDLTAYSSMGGWGLPVIEYNTWDTCRMTLEDFST